MHADVVFVFLRLLWAYILAMLMFNAREHVLFEWKSILGHSNLCQSLFRSSCWRNLHGQIGGVSLSASPFGTDRSAERLRSLFQDVT